MKPPGPRATRTVATVVTVALAATLARSGFGAETSANGRPVHPNPAISNIAVDYGAAPRAPDGSPSNLGPLGPAVIAQALADNTYLAYQTVGDLGGFKPAPVGYLAWSSGGHAIVGETFKSQVPHYAKAGDGKVNSFAFIGSPAPAATPPDNGRQPLPGLGVPPATPPTSAPSTLPPPNQGFAGTPPTAPAAPATTTPPPTTAPPSPTAPTRTTRPPTMTRPRTTTPPPATTAPATTAAPTPTTTTTTTTTTTAATTSASTTTSSGGGSTSSGSGGSSSGGSTNSSSCGTTGLSITSDHSTCVLYATNMAPGGSRSEVMTIRNDADVAYSLYLEATGTQNQLWNDLRLGVWRVGTAAPSPLPLLSYWTTQFNKLALSPLQPGDSVKLNVELLLSSTAGNADQNLKAVITFVWRATA